MKQAHAPVTETDPGAVPPVALDPATVWRAMATVVPRSDRQNLDRAVAVLRLRRTGPAPLRRIVAHKEDGGDMADAQ